MPSLDQHKSSEAVKLLVAAESGTGKSGAMASLVDAGYRLRILDYDDGLSPLARYVKDKSKLVNVSYVTLLDKYSTHPTRGITLQTATAFTKGMQLLASWREPAVGDSPAVDLGAANEWGTDTFIVIDTLTFMAKACLNQVLSVNNSKDKHPEIQHWGAAMDLVEMVLERLKAMSCNVLVNTHTENREGSSKTWPAALGSKLPPKVGRYFDNLITLKAGPTGLREFRTTPTDGLSTKTAAPCPEKLPLATGLADLCEYLTGKRKYTAPTVNKPA